MKEIQKQIRDEGMQNQQSAVPKQDGTYFQGISNNLKPTASFVNPKRNEQRYKK